MPGGWGDGGLGGRQMKGSQQIRRKEHQQCDTVSVSHTQVQDQWIFRLLFPAHAIICLAYYQNFFLILCYWADKAYTIPVVGIKRRSTLSLICSERGRGDCFTDSAFITCPKSSSSMLYFLILYVEEWMPEFFPFNLGSTMLMIYICYFFDLIFSGEY